MYRLPWEDLLTQMDHHADDAAERSGHLDSSEEYAWNEAKNVLRKAGHDLNEILERLEMTD